MKVLIGSVVAATGASICCIGPVVLSAIGAGALGAAASQFDVYRPILLTATVALLGSSFYSTYRPSVDRCNTDGTCKPSARRFAKLALWITTLLVVLLATFPYYIDFFV